MPQIRHFTLITATVAGYSALLMWSCSGLFSTILRTLPIFEVLLITFFVSLVFTSSLITTQKSWHRVKQPTLLWLIGMGAILGNDVLFLAAFHYAPAAEVDLISYLWPLIVALFTGLLPNESFSLRHILAALCGFCGLYYLLPILHHHDGLQLKFIPGYLCAFADALIWGSYVLVSRYYKQTHPMTTGLYTGMLTPIVLVLHLCFEPTVWPNSQQWFCLIAVGLTTHSSAYILWDYGVKRGHFKILTLLTYTAPFISILLLASWNFAQLNRSLIGACLLITIAGGIAASDKPYRNNR